MDCIDTSFNDDLDCIDAWNRYVDSKIQEAWDDYMASPDRKIIINPKQIEGGPILEPIPHPSDILEKNLAEFKKTEVYVSFLTNGYNRLPQWFFDSWMNGVRNFD